MITDFLGGLNYYFNHYKKMEWNFQGLCVGSLSGSPDHYIDPLLLDEPKLH